jgi:hypothetical protein
MVLKNPIRQITNEYKKEYNNQPIYPVTPCAKEPRKQQIMIQKEKCQKQNMFEKITLKWLCLKQSHTTIEIGRGKDRYQ